MSKKDSVPTNVLPSMSNLQIIAIDTVRLVKEASREAFGQAGKGRARTFTDRRKQASKDACKKGNW